MRKSSWEIILAGFVFVGMAIYLIESRSTTESDTYTATSADSIRVEIENNEPRIIELKNLQNLENLENLENLKNLEKLKVLANFMPAEVKSEFIDEINAAIKEFDQESVDVQVDIETGEIAIDKVQDIKSGSWSTISPGVYAYITEFDAHSIEDAEVKLPFGSITVRGTDSKTAKLVIQASGQISSKKDLESQIETRSNVEETSAEFQIKTLSKQSRDENIHLQATLNLPVHTAVSMVTKAGHIQATNISGEQSYETEGGHITLEQLNGAVDARTSGGHITISDSKGELMLRSFGGHIRAQNAEGNIRMKTSGGNLHAQNITGQLDASTNGGNIEIRFLKVTGASNATTGAGTITIWIPQSENAEIDLAGNSVELDSGLHFKGGKSAGSAKGSLGNSGPAIHAKTSYGKVILKAIND